MSTDGPAAAERTACGPARPTDPVPVTPWRRAAILCALMLGALAFNTAENLPVGLLELISESLGASVPAVGLLVTGYAVTVAVASLPLAHATRAVPRRHVLTGLLGALVVSSVLAALAGAYGLLLVARLLTALAQALFWAVLGPVAVGLFAPEVRGRVVGAISFAGSLALVLGVPGGTWLGQQTNWRVPFAGLALLGLVCLVIIATLLPTSPPDEEPAAQASHPDRRRFAVVLVAGALSATGAFTGFTYLVKLLGDVGEFAPRTVSLLLGVFGLACLVGVCIAGPLLDRLPYATLTAAVATQAVGMLGLYGGGADHLVTLASLTLMGGALGPVFMATQYAMLRWAPTRTDLALAANSGAYNAGIATGAALGGALLPLLRVQGTFLVGGLLSGVACLLLLAERLLVGRPLGSCAPNRKRARAR